MANDQDDLEDKAVDCTGMNYSTFGMEEIQSQKQIMEDASSEVWRQALYRTALHESMEVLPQWVMYKAAVLSMWSRDMESVEKRPDNPRASMSSRSFIYALQDVQFGLKDVAYGLRVHVDLESNMTMFAMMI